MNHRYGRDHGTGFTPYHHTPDSSMNQHQFPYSSILLLTSYGIMVYFKQVFNDAIEALRISYRKMNPFCVPFATTNMGSAMLAMDLVSHSQCCWKIRIDL